MPAGEELGLAVTGGGSWAEAMLCISDTVTDAIRNFFIGVLEKEF
jgi:hypothetical protein